MAIIFEQQKKKQRNLSFIFLGFFAITILVIWQGFFKKGTAVFTPSQTALPKKEIEINFGVLDNSQLKQLQPFLEIQPFEESTTTQGKIKKTIKVGRENPFLTY